jgi:hypothetical protein
MLSSSLTLDYSMFEETGHVFAAYGLKGESGQHGKDNRARVRARKKFSRYQSIHVNA